MRPRIENVATWFPPDTRKTAMLRLVTLLTKVVVQAATQAGKMSRRCTSHRMRNRKAPRSAAASARFRWICARPARAIW